MKPPKLLYKTTSGHSRDLNAQAMQPTHKHTTVNLCVIDLLAFVMMNDEGLAALIYSSNPSKKMEGHQNRQNHRLNKPRH